MQPAVTCILCCGLNQVTSWHIAVSYAFHIPQCSVLQYNLQSLQCNTSCSVTFICTVQCKGLVLYITVQSQVQWKGPVVHVTVQCKLQCKGRGLIRALGYLLHCQRPLTSHPLHCRRQCWLAQSVLKHIVMHCILQYYILHCLVLQNNTLHSSYLLQCHRPLTSHRLQSLHYIAQCTICFTAFYIPLHCNVLQALHCSTICSTLHCLHSSCLLHRCQNCLAR